jgi:DNA primase
MSLFNAIKNQLSILDVVSQYVHLKQMGNYWKGPCPFHAEKDASFTISPDKQIFYCFGCHAAGDVIAFIAKIENLGQHEAAKFLVEQHRLTIPQEYAPEYSSQKRDEKQVYYALYQAVSLWAHKQLLQAPHAHDYLVTRGLSQESIKNFTIGYFPSGVLVLNKLIKELQQQNFLLNNLIEYSIIQEGHTGYYSPFEERIIFPIKDTLGNFCGFGGRVFQANDQRPKYYNSKESIGFSKGKLLFGFDNAKKNVQQSSYAFLVEGYLDCIVMHQYGFTQTVATLGTACTLEHLKLLARSCHTLFVLYDGDAAGHNAMLKLTQLCWETNLELKVITLPPSEDPASFLQKGNSLGAFIEQAQDIFTFFITASTQNFTQKTLSEKLTLAEKILTVIRQLDNELKQDLLLQQTAQAMGIPFESLKKNIHTPKYTPPVRQRVINVSNKNNETDGGVLEEKIISAIINSLRSEKVLTVELALVPYFSTQAQEICAAFFHFVKATDREQHSFSNFIDTLNDQQKQWIITVCMRHEALVDQEVFDQFMYFFCKNNWKTIVLAIKEDIAKAKEKNDAAMLTQLLEKLSTLKKGLIHRGLI